MTSPFKPARGPNGEVLQGSMPKSAVVPITERSSSRGLLVRGVVTKTYAYDEGSAVTTDSGGRDQIAIYCDVLVYSGLEGTRSAFLPRCLVSTDRGGVHEGEIWRPHAATIDIGNDVIDSEFRGTNVADLDGDHVLVGFLDDDFSLPVILRGIPHPNADIGNQFKLPGTRLRLRAADGEPRFWKHHGAFFGFDRDGDFFLDLTKAHRGAIVSDGSEPAPLENGTSGNALFSIQKGATLRIDGPEQQTIFVRPDGSLRIQLATTSIEIQASGRLIINVPSEDIEITSADRIQLNCLRAEVNANDMNIVTSTVELGQGAVEPVIQGMIFKTALDAFNAAIVAELGLLAQFSAQALLLLAPPPTDPINATVAALGGAAANVVTQLTTLSSAPYLSTSVKTKG